MIGLLHYLEHEICKLIPKGAFVIITELPLGISLRISLRDYAKIQACIKSIGNHAKKSYSA